MPVPVVVAVAAAVRVLGPIVFKGALKLGKKHLPRIGRWIKKLERTAKQWVKNKVELIKGLGQKGYARFSNLLTGLKSAFRKAQAALKRVQSKVTEIKGVIKKKISDLPGVGALLKKVEEFKAAHALLYTALVLLFTWVRRMWRFFNWVDRIEKASEVVEDVLQRIKEWWECRKEARDVEQTCREETKAQQASTKKLDVGLKSLRAIA